MGGNEETYDWKTWAFEEKVQYVLVTTRVLEHYNGIPSYLKASELLEVAALHFKTHLNHAEPRIHAQMKDNYEVFLAMSKLLARDGPTREVGGKKLNVLCSNLLKDASTYFSEAVDVNPEYAEDFRYYAEIYRLMAFSLIKNPLERL